MARTVKRLHDLEIDEVSLVDRPANQHAAVAFSKRDEEDSMPGIYDAEGVEVFEDELAHGDVVYDDSGNEFVFVDDAAAAELGGDGTSAELDDQYDFDAADEGAYEGELAGVGKAFAPRLRARGRLGRMGVRQAAINTRVDLAAGAHRSRQAANSALSSRTSRAVDRTKAWGQQSLSDNPRRWAGGAAGGTALAGAGGGGVAYGHRDGIKKSLGDSVLEQLSKSLDDGDRDEVIAKAMDLVEEANLRAARAEQIAKSLADERDLDGYRQVAAGYGLPVDPDELGGVLKRAAEVLPDRDVAVLDRLFSAAGEQSVMFDELGYNGSSSGSNLLDEVNALALETVGKSGLSQEAATVALFEANPAAYDEYLREQR